MPKRYSSSDAGRDDDVTGTCGNGYSIHAVYYYDDDDSSATLGVI
jgi:hypothetical protein